MLKKTIQPSKSQGYEMRVIIILLKKSLLSSYNLDDNPNNLFLSQFTNTKILGKQSCFQNF